LKWAGGKTQLLQELESHVPRFENYFEPFLGGGALFFRLASRGSTFRARLSDLNAELVNAYRVVKSDAGGLIARLRQHETAYARDPSSFYYDLRKASPAGKVQRAARIVALNKTCYNGLYRVNSAGEFNVPIGRYKDPSICNEEQLLNASAALRSTRAHIRTCDYATALLCAGKGDFVYLDPPFVPLNKTSSFVGYTQQGFTLGDQERLAKVFHVLHKKGCKVLLSNSDTPEARRLYSGFDQFRIRASRAINCKGESRTGYNELLVRNFVP
jgi:DNA adenine methylase